MFQISSAGVAEQKSFHNFNASEITVLPCLYWSFMTHCYVDSQREISELTEKECFLHSFQEENGNELILSKASYNKLQISK